MNSAVIHLERVRQVAVDSLIVLGLVLTLAVELPF
jgi:hypothetical protein